MIKINEGAERELANTIYVLLAQADTSGVAKRIIAEEVGRVLIESKERDIIRVLLILTNKYIDVFQQQTKKRLISNRQTYQEIMEGGA